MEQIFDVTPTVKEEKVSLPVVSAKYNEADIKQDLNDAYQQSKENLQGIIDQGKDAMEEILNIAKAGQHPRAFEVYSGLLKNMTEANDRLLKIQKEMREMEGIKKETNNRLKLAENYINRTFYGENVDQFQENNPTFSKLVRRLMGGASMAFYSLNPVSTIKNKGGMTFQRLIFAA